VQGTPRENTDILCPLPEAMGKSWEKVGFIERERPIKANT